MKVKNVKAEISDAVPVMTLVLMVLLSILLAGWQLLDVESISGFQVYLPMVQAVLLLIAVTLGIAFYKIKTNSLRSQDVLGLTHGASTFSFRNTEAVLGAAAGGVIRINRDLQAEYLSEVASVITGWFSEEALGRPVHDVINVQGVRATDTLKQIIEEQFIKPDSIFDLHDVKILTKSSEAKYVKFKTAPVQAADGSIEYVALVIQDVTDDRAAMQELYNQASRDSLTGLYNRKSFQEFLEKALSSDSSDKDSNVLCYMDLDHFKTVNDVCGHAAGDELLKQIADLFSKRVRSTDRLARTGGDEFAILLRSCNVALAKTILERILEDVQAYRFTWNRNTFQVGVSMGALEFDTSYRITDMGNLMLKADEACYTAKKLGRNQLYIHDLSEATNDSPAESGENWEHVLKSALKYDHFLLYVQPILPLQAEVLLRERQYEVLIRLPHEGEVLSPGSFMPAAQRLGLMGVLDRWVVEKTIQNIASGNYADGENRQQIFTINLSADSVNDEEFIGFVGRMLKQYGVSASILCFEISESIVLANFMRAQTLLDELVNIGATGSLDDFGSGISSLSYLRDLPVSYLKIDGAFIRNMSKNRVDAAMVDAVNKVGQVMNLSTIAESVENDITKQLLKRMGVNYAQGYHCGKPVAFDQIHLAQAS
ncbi:MAG: EAL domain-containing protein [Leucothrix sp.]